MQEQLLVLFFVTLKLHIKPGSTHTLCKHRHQLRLHNDLLLRFGSFHRLSRLDGSSRCSGGFYKLRIVLDESQQNAEFANKEMKFFQNFHRIFTFQISLMNRHIAHLADVVNGIDENLIVHIVHKPLIRYHLKNADTVLTG